MILTPKYLHTSPFTLDAVGIELPLFDEAHPNKAPWRGILTRIDEPSTRPPNGSGGHRVLIPRAVCEAALPSLIGMAIDVSGDLKDHDHQLKIGIITDAEIAGRDVYVNGIMYAKDFADIVARIRANKPQLGMSYEIAEVDVDDPSAEVWTLNHFVFTGAAILRRDAAAYAQTAIAARAEEEAVMPEEKSKILDELAKLSQQITTMRAAAADEDAKKKMDEEAAALAAKKAEEDAAAAKKKMDEDAAAAEAEAAKCREADEDAQAAMFAAMLKAAMESRGGAQDAGKDGDAGMMHRMLGMLMRAMVYPNAAPQDAKHDDKNEDLAMLKQLLKPSAMKAAGVSDIATKRMEKDMAALRKDMEAQAGLITDTMQKMTGLITDMQAQMKNLATDANHGNNGGPVRKTMHATGERFIGPFDAAGETGTDGKPKQFTMAEIDAALEDEHLDAAARIAKKLELTMAGKVKQPA